MENSFLICCHYSLLIGTRSECDRFSCQEGKHLPVFNLYYHKNNNEYFHCLNRDQLGKYWKCVVEDWDSFSPSRCDQCNICKEMSDIFTEWQDSYFFYPKTSVANNQEKIPYRPVLWRVFNSVINKNNNRFRIEIRKSIPHRGLVLNYGKTCWSRIYFFLIRQYYFDKKIIINFVIVLFVNFQIVTARKIIFSRSQNIMESSKRPSVYHLSINFLAEKNTVFSITKKFKTRTSS